MALRNLSSTFSGSTNNKSRNILEVFTANAEVPALAVSSAAYVDIKTCTVTFNADLNEPTAETPANYTLTGPSTIVASAATMVGRVVTLVLGDNMEGGTYTVTITGVEDDNGVAIVSGHNTATFSVPQPSVVSAAFVDADTCTVTFSEDMDPATAQDVGNYTFTVGPNTPVVSVASLLGDVVTLDLDRRMSSGDYTASVSGVKNIDGIVIYPDPGTATYTAVVSPFGGHATLTTSLVSYWKLNDNFNDSHTGVHHGAFYNSPVFAPAKIDSGVVLDGATQYGKVLNNVAFQGTTTSYSFWFKVDTIPEAIAYLLNHSASRYVFLRDDGYLSVREPDLLLPISIPSNSPISTGVWYFICVVHAGSNVYFYLDNVLQTGSVVSILPGSVSDNMFWGSTSVPGSYFDGMVDEIGWWEKGLSSGERTDLYNSGAGLSY